MRILLLVMAAVLGLSISAGAMIPGGVNELQNGDFSAGLTGWEYTPGDVIVSAYGNPSNAAQCYRTTPSDVNQGWGDQIRQVVDDTKNPLWDWDLHAKIVEVDADISIDTKDFAVGGVRIRLDYWDEKYNYPVEQTGPPAPGVAGYHVTDWVEYTSLQGYSPAFTHISNRWDLPIQPRWISLEIEFKQPNNVINRIDNVVLSSQCVPEPSVCVALFSGLIGLGATGVFKRR